MADPKFFHKLQKGKQPRGVMARVIRKWTIYDTSGQNNLLHVGMVLADAKGDAIYAQILDELIDEKADLFQIGQVYMIKKFFVEDSRKTYKAVDKPLMIDITPYTSAEVVPNPPNTFPEYIYKISPFSIIRPTKVVFQYTDVIGYLVKYEALETFVPKNKEKSLTLRHIYIKDLRDQVMKVTLWGDHATNFSIDNIYDDQTGNLIVCLIVGCTPREDFMNNDKIALSGSPACSYYFNPPIPEAAPFHSRFKNIQVFIERPLASEEASPVPVRDVELPRKSVAELHKVDPYNEEEPGPFKCTVTISSIVTGQNWWYMACTPCKKKAEQQMDGRYKCPKCQGSETAPRYLLTFIGTDETGDARFFAYDDEAEKIIQKECQSIMNPLAARVGLPQAIQNIVNKTYTFSVNLNDDSCKTISRRQYQVKAVLERPSRRTAVQIASLNTSQLPIVSADSQNKQHAEGSASHIEKARQETTQPQIEPVPHNTPAPTTHSDDDINKDHGSRSPRAQSNVQRTLFQRTDKTTKVSAHPAMEPVTDTAEGVGKHTDEDHDPHQPPPKRSKPTADKNSSKGPSRK